MKIKCFAVRWPASLAAILQVVPISGHAQSEQAASITIDPLPSAVDVGEPLAVSLQVRDFSGAPFTNWNGGLRFRLQSYSTVQAPVISEIDVEGERIEVLNPGATTRDLSGWELQVLTGNRQVPEPARAILSVPPGTVLNAGSVFTFSAGGTPPGAFPDFYSGVPFDDSPLGWPFGIVRLFDQHGVIADEVYVREPGQVTAPLLWQDGHLWNLPLPGQTFARVAPLNRHREQDWTNGPPTWGSPDPALDLPWRRPVIAELVEPSQIVISNGSWSGQIRLQQPGLGQQLVVAATNGISGRSAPLDVLAQPGLSLSIAEELRYAWEAVAPTGGFIVVSIPTALTESLVLELQVSDPLEFDVPAVAILPAGETSLPIEIFNRDDVVADGSARVTLTVSAPGYASATGELVNHDDETGELHLILPPPLAENSGWNAERGQVLLGTASAHDVVVNLQAAAPLTVPAQVVVPAGQRTATFPIRVGDDLVVNPSPWQLPVSAAMINWPATTNWLAVLDDEDPGFTLEASNTFVEGTSVGGRLVFATPRDVAIEIELASSSPLLSVPAAVQLPAGQQAVEFTITIADNTETNALGGGQLCVTVPGLPQFCSPFHLMDDEVAPAYLRVYHAPQAAFSGVPFEVWVDVLNNMWQQQVVNDSVSLELLPESQLVTLAPENKLVALTNGLWAGPVTIDGEALDVRLQGARNGLTGSSMELDVIDGREVAVPLADVGWHPGLARMLVVVPGATNQSPRLVELDPESGAFGRALALPRDAHRIALTDSGTHAWLAATNGTLLHIDIAAWQVVGDFELGEDGVTVEVVDLAVLPGGTDDVVLSLVSSPALYHFHHEVVLFSNASIQADRAAFSGPVISLLPVEIEEETVLFGLIGGRVFRAQISPTGITWQLESDRIYSSWVYEGALTFVNDRLIQGDGWALSPDTLQTVGQVGNLQGLGRAFPESDLMVFLNPCGLTAYALSDGAPRGDHSLPCGDGQGEVRRILRWGDRGIAWFLTGRDSLMIARTPLVTGGMLPDLQLTLPAAETLTTEVLEGYILGREFTWELSVTNVGFVSAPAVLLELSSGEQFYLGSLGPGEGTTLEYLTGLGGPGIRKEFVTVSSPIGDASPLDNEGWAVTRVINPPFPSVREMIFGMTHLIAAPTGDRLHVAVSTEAGDLDNGVVTIDPATATTVAFYATPVAPQRLAVSADGSVIYALGADRVLRIDSTTASVTTFFTLGGEALLDLACVPGANDVLVVATSARVAVLDATGLRTQQFLSSADDRGLGWTQDVLWVADPGVLNSFSVTAAGLAGTGAPVAYQRAYEYNKFSSDGARLYFPGFTGGVLDAITRQVSYPDIRGTAFVADPDNGMLFSLFGPEITVYDLETLDQEEKMIVPAAPTEYSKYDPVRWGDQGLAYRTYQNQLCLITSPLLDRQVVGNLGVQVSPPVDPREFLPLTWSITVTNHTGQAAPQTQLTIELPGGLRDAQLSGATAQRYGNTYFVWLGDFPAHGSATVTLTGWSFRGDLTLTAQVVSAIHESHPADNEVEVPLQLALPTAELSMLSATAPMQVAPDTSFQVTYVMTNRGPETARPAFLEIPHLNDAEVLDLSCVDCTTGGMTNGVLVMDDMPPGASRTVTVTVRPTGAGLVGIVAQVSALVNEPNFADNQKGHVVVVPPGTITNFITKLATPVSIKTAWNPVRRQLIAGFTEVSDKLLVMDDDTLEPQFEVPLSSRPTHLAVNADGRHVWAALQESTFVRIDLELRQVDQSILYHPNGGPVWAIATPPGQPQTLLAAVGPGWTGDVVRVYDNGVPRPYDWTGVGWAGGGVQLHFLEDGRLFIARSQLLREFQLVPDGLAELANFDYAAEYSDITLSHAGHKLFFGSGRRLDLDTGLADDRLAVQYRHQADPVTGTLYSATSHFLAWNLARFEVRALDSDSLEPLWVTNLYTLHESAGRITTLGTNGAVMTGERLWLVRPSRLGAQQPDLAVQGEWLAPLAGPGFTAPVQLTVTNRSAWISPATTLTVQTPAGLAVVLGDGEVTNRLDLELGMFTGHFATNVMIAASQAGNFALSLAIAGGLPDVAPADNQMELPLVVPVPPLFVFDDTAIAEGTHNLTRLHAALSKPVAAEVVVAYTIEPLTAQANDFFQLSGEFRFAAGTARASTYLVVPDSMPEPTELALMRFSSMHTGLLASEARVWIVNDDAAQVSLQALSVFEGNAGLSYADVMVTASAGAEMPIEVMLATENGTAEAGVDYLSRTGFLSFPPEGGTTRFTVAILGDTTFEPAETLWLRFLEGANASPLTFASSLTIRNDDAPPAPEMGIRFLSPGLVEIEFDTVAGASYWLQSRPDVTSESWQNISLLPPGSGGVQSIALSNQPPARRFYRLRAQ